MHSVNNLELSTLKLINEYLQFIFFKFFYNTRYVSECDILIYLRHCEKENYQI